MRLKTAARLLWVCAVAAMLPTSAHSASELIPLPDVTASDTFTSRYQVTYNWNRHPSFRAAYSGDSSLFPTSEKMYTFSATAHWGWRVWQDGEIYFNPEIAQGVPFSNDLIGLGTFTNGEITRAGGARPKLYRQRLFLRQTWNHGGEQEKQDEDFNQFAGMVDRRRTVLTLGNFSLFDVFDDNAYAKDPRLQFMNWANWTYSAYDYAGDARGFSWGAALEWYRDDWVFRIGRMAMPKIPNDLELDFRLGTHFGDQIEIEHAHTLASQPGRVRPLAYRNRMVMARFDDATQFLKDNPGTDPQAIFAVRNFARNKTGAGFNIEQAINDSTGVFLRAFRSDGKTETVAFTEADASLSSGISIGGGAWKRPDDRLGMAWAINGISNARRNYLASGGISFFIGDGALQYAPERVAEIFYSFGLRKDMQLTADYQQIQNPAYNSSRGPVNVFSARFHTEF